MGTIYMKRAVITGPTGSIGIALINELEANGIEVVAVFRFQCHVGIDGGTVSQQLAGDGQSYAMLVGYFDG